MKNRKFMTNNLKLFYNFLLQNPPKRKSSLIAGEFWAGYDDIKNNRQVHTSFAEMAYWAGQDYKNISEDK